MKRRVLLAIPLVLLVVGCATGPKYTEVADKLPKPAASEGRIWFLRSEYAGGGIQPDVRLNGAVVGTAKPGGMYFADRPPGNYEVATSTEVERKLTFTLAAGEEKYVSLKPTIGILVWRIVPELIDREAATAQMKELIFIGKLP